jgi:hypothetical protein
VCSRARSGSVGLGSQIALPGEASGARTLVIAMIVIGIKVFKPFIA